ncbi:magnesium transporter [Roseibium hamelinense]|uniref:Magnesium transport protein CorA n=1 Tax=Roseibium hamelinense TaxID=150831 RepID=A0A562STR7_9HYPH|nr:magnesium transporter CorA family protein [Roseibium hamelinense]MTI42713.1 magnesium transporter [Roseibium hamelinense]TWI84592.1 magnesium transporter [Roseibium hamelinense]
MIIAYCPASTGLQRVVLEEGQAIPANACWIDLFTPSKGEQIAAEQLMGAQIPTREEVASIETSARLYDEPGAIVMTALLPMAAENPDPSLSSVIFVLNAKRMVTVRYGEPRSLVIFSKKVQADISIAHTGPALFFAMLDIVVDRCADILEEASARYDKLSLQVFEEGLSSRKTTLYQDAIRAQGRIGLRTAKMHEVCASLSRVTLFLGTHSKKLNLSTDQIDMCKTIGRDIHSIKEHGDALDNNLSFLLDATIGLVTLEQNQIIKIFSVLGVIFLPPTLIASIYGMNFENMPELKWSLGFPFSIVLMGGSIALTFLFFRLKKLL